MAILFRKPQEAKRKLSSLPSSEQAHELMRQREALLSSPTETVGKTNHRLAAANNMSPRQVARLLRLNSLIPSLRQQVDCKRLPLYAAVSLSYLGPQEQEQLRQHIGFGGTMPDMKTAAALRRLYENGEWSTEKVGCLLGTPPKSPHTIVIQPDELPRSLQGLPPRQLWKTLLEYYINKIEEAEGP